MADTPKFSYLDGEGNKFEANDTAANRSKVTAQGYKIDESIGHQVGEIARGIDESLPGWLPTTWATKAVAKTVANVAGAKAADDLPKWTGPAAGKFIYVDGDGAQHEANDSPANRAKVAEQGYKMPSLEQLRVMNDPAFQGVRGEVKTLAANAQDAYTLGLAGMASDAGVLPEGTFAPALQDKKLREALNEENPYSAGLGQVAGTVANMLTPGLNMGGAATKAGALTERGLAKIGLEAGEGLISKVGVGAAKEAAKGAVYAAPRAAGTLVLQDDPKAAGEILLAGVGIGALFGAAGPLASKGATSAAGAADSLSARALAAAEGKIAANAEAVAPTLGQRAKGFVGGLALDVAEGVPIVGGVVKAGRKVSKLFTEHPESVAEGIRKVREVSQKIGTHLEGLPAALENIGASRVGQAAELGSINAVGRLLGSPDKKSTKQEQWNAVQEKVLRLSADPEHRTEVVAAQAATIPSIDPSVAAAYGEKTHAALDYIFGVMPKNPHDKAMFSGRAQWMPSDLEMARFGRRLEVVMNPFAVINELRTGTLTRDHVEALESVYPSVAAEMRAQVLQLATQPTAPVMTKSQRSQVAILMGGPLDTGSRPQALKSFQSVYSGDAPAPAEKPSKNIRGDKLPSLATDAQRLAKKAR